MMFQLTPSSAAAAVDDDDDGGVRCEIGPAKTNDCNINANITRLNLLQNAFGSYTITRIRWSHSSGDCVIIDRRNTGPTVEIRMYVDRSIVTGAEYRSLASFDILCGRCNCRLFETH